MPRPAAPPGGLGKLTLNEPLLEGFLLLSLLLLLLEAEPDALLLEAES